MIFILAPTRKLAEHVASELRERDHWRRFAYGVTHTWVDPRDVRLKFVGQRGATVVIATTTRPAHQLGEGWRTTAWKEALNWLFTNGKVYDLEIFFHHCP